MRFALDSQQEEIRRTAHDLLAQRSSLERVREAAESATYDATLWTELVELGWTGLAVTEEHGGLGLGAVELAILCEELGYAVTPSPFLANACATVMLEAAGSQDQLSRWLPSIAAGELTATLARAVDGEAGLVPDADSAAILILCDGEDGATLVEPGDASIEALATIDPTRRYGRVALHGGERLEGAVAAGLDRAEVMLAAELTGLAQRALDIAVEYVKDRRQFGHPIGSFQGVSHRCAEVFLMTEAARAATYYAAWASDAEPDLLPAAASVAKIAGAEAARRAAAVAIQCQGAIGFTWEADLHWLLKRAHADVAQLGEVDEHRRRVARLAAERSHAGEVAV